MYIPSGDLYGVWGSSGSDVFVVGIHGTVWNYDGMYWKRMDSGTDAELRGVWGSSSSDVFVVGKEGTIIHFDGNIWTVMDSGTLQHLWGVWGSSGSDVFAVGSKGTVLHYDGVAWSLMVSGVTTFPLYGVWGSSGSDVFAVGMGGTVLHYDGVTWSPPMDIGPELYGVWGSSGSDVFAVCGSVRHYDGISWSPVSGPQCCADAVWGSSGSDVFVVGTGGTISHYDGYAWSPMDSGTLETLCGVWGSSGSDVFVVGRNGVVRHYDAIAEPEDCPGGVVGGTPVTITFDTVTVGGDTTLCTSPQGPPPPSGFRLGNPPVYYEIDTTATYLGNIEVCIDYSGITYGNENGLKLTHKKEGEPWRDVTSSLDTQNNIICGIVDSFSLFAIFAPIDDSPSVGGIAEPIDKMGLLVPWMTFATLILLTVGIVVFRRVRK
jgi:hypothetical protein